MRHFIITTIFSIFGFSAFSQSSFGFTYQSVDLAKGGMENTYVLVLEVIKGSPADKAGLKFGDRITLIDVTYLPKKAVEDIPQILAETETGSFEIKRYKTSTKEVETIKLSMTKEPRSNFLNKCIYGDCQNGDGVYIDDAGREYRGKFVNGNTQGSAKIFINGSEAGEAGLINGRWNGKVRIFYPTSLNHYMKDKTLESNLYPKNLGLMAQEGMYKEGVLQGPIDLKKYMNESLLTHYTGSSENNIANGTGTDTLFVGDEMLVTTGTFQKGLVHGKGKTMRFYKGKEEETAEGNFVNGALSGQGKTKTLSYSYEGNFKNGKPSGLGSKTYSYGDKYVGQFLDGYMAGKGILIYANGNRYEGDFYKDDMWGEVKATYASGSVYTGTYIAGKKHGKFHVENYDGKGITIDAEYKNDDLNGNGVIVDKEGNKFSGFYVNGERYGYGENIMKNGQELRGEMCAGLFHGLGTYKKPTDKEPVSYFYIKGQGWPTFIGDNVQYTATTRLNDSSIYKGFLVDGKMHGKGTVTPPNGLVYTRVYQNGKMMQSQVENNKENSKAFFIDTNFYNFSFYKNPKEIIYRKNKVMFWSKQFFKEYNLFLEGSINLKDNYYGLVEVSDEIKNTKRIANFSTNIWVNQPVRTIDLKTNEIWDGIYGKENYEGNVRHTYPNGKVVYEFWMLGKKLSEVEM